MRKASGGRLAGGGVSDGQGAALDLLKAMALRIHSPAAPGEKLIRLGPS